VVASDHWVAAAVTSLIKMASGRKRVRRIKSSGKIILFLNLFLTGDTITRVNERAVGSTVAAVAAPASPRRDFIARIFGRPDAGV
jgi:hypothetical protein